MILIHLCSRLRLLGAVFVNIICNSRSCVRGSLIMGNIQNIKVLSQGWPGNLQTIPGQFWVLHTSRKYSNWKSTRITSYWVACDCAPFYWMFRYSHPSKWRHTLEEVILSWNLTCEGNGFVIVGKNHFIWTAIWIESCRFIIFSQPMDQFSRNWQPSQELSASHRANYHTTTLFLETFTVLEHSYKILKSVYADSMLLSSPSSDTYFMWKCHICIQS